MDKNKAVFKLANFPPVLWINLDRFPERKKYMEDQFDYWEIKDHHRISGIDGAEYESYLKGTVPPSMNDGELACVMSHLSAIKYFVEETDSSSCMTSCIFTSAPCSLQKSVRAWLLFL